MNELDVVEIKEIIKAPEFKAGPMSQRPPKVGDRATILEVFTKPRLGYLLECSDDDGIALWMETFGPEDVVMEIVWRYEQSI